MNEIVCSEEMREYFDSLARAADKCYLVAKEARSKGFDSELDVEIPQAEDLASRVERLLKDYAVAGVAHRIRELSRTHDREEVSLLIAKEMAVRSSRSKEEAMERAIRVGLAVLTEGILVAPLEGIATVKIGKNKDGSTYADLYYAGPIRSAGGTGQALSVLIADVVRRELKIGSYKPTKAEVERFKEEIPLYKQCQHLQYTPTDEEIDLIVSNCPICINGEGTEEVEISGYRDLPRIETNRVRGGACLVIAEGLCLKAPKILRHVRNLKIDGWDFIEEYLKGKKEDRKEGAAGIEPSYKFLQNIVAGRPILSHPSRKGGFRLRYGRTRATRLAPAALHPATMQILDEFIAVGTQIKIERPGKAGAVTPCDSIEGPIVLLKNGDLVQVKNVKEAKTLEGKVKTIVDLGEILIPYGEFLENNHLLIPGAYGLEWYAQELKKAAGDLPEDWKDPTPERAFEISLRYGVPLHPKYNLFWHDLDVRDVYKLRNYLAQRGRYENGKLILPADDFIKELLVDLGAPHTVKGEEILVGPHSLAIMKCLGLEAQEGGLKPVKEGEASDSLELVSKLSGVIIRARGPTRIGARMARPEKAKERRMKPPPHSLFPVGKEGGPQRLVKSAAEKDIISVEVGTRICKSCGKRWFLPKCSCGGHTTSKEGATLQKIPMREVFEKAVSTLKESQVPEIKGVQGMISKNKNPEILEKGILRAKHEIFVFKDGTTRFDMTDLPLTHFKPCEIGLTVEKAKQLGYLKDIHGNPLEREAQLVELKPQDFIASRSCGEYLVKVSRFVDDLLKKVYGMEPFYKAETPEDLIGHLIVGLAPHTSSGVLARLIGYTEARAGYAHPFFHAGKRRNCDGDEDCVMLLLDGLLNFSRSFLPERRGGLMDAPLVLTTRIDPNEIDKEAHSIDLSPSYPLEFYEATLRYAHPREVEDMMDTAGKRIGSILQYEDFGFTHETDNIAQGPLRSSYKIGSMISKMEGQLHLAMRIRAVDASDVVAKIVTHHFLPDLIGNLKAFSSQQFRCTKCNVKYRRIPLSGRCTSCNGNLTLTVHENSVKKYLEVSKRISQEYGVSQYLQQRIALIDSAIESLFTNERDQTLKLEDFF